MEPKRSEEGKSGKKQMFLLGVVGRRGDGEGIEDDLGTRGRDRQSLPSASASVTSLAFLTSALPRPGYLFPAGLSGRCTHSRTTWTLGMLPHPYLFTGTSRGLRVPLTDLLLIHRPPLSHSFLNPPPDYSSIISTSSFSPDPIPFPVTDLYIFVLHCR